MRWGSRLGLTNGTRKHLLSSQGLPGAQEGQQVHWAVHLLFSLSPSQVTLLENAHKMGFNPIKITREGVKNTDGQALPIGIGRLEWRPGLFLKPL